MEFIPKFFFPAWEMVVKVRIRIPLLPPFVWMEIEIPILRVESNQGRDSASDNMNAQAPDPYNAQDAFPDAFAQANPYVSSETEFSSDDDTDEFHDAECHCDSGQATHDPSVHLTLEIPGFPDLFGNGEIEEAALDGHAAQREDDVLVRAFVQQFNLGP
jgi:hypothetical protein